MRRHCHDTPSSATSPLVSAYMAACVAVFASCVLVTLALLSSFGRATHSLPPSFCLHVTFHFACALPFHSPHVHRHTHIARSLEECSAVQFSSVCPSASAIAIALAVRAPARSHTQFNMSAAPCTRQHEGSTSNTQHSAIISNQGSGRTTSQPQHHGSTPSPPSIPSPSCLSMAYWRSGYRLVDVSLLTLYFLLTVAQVRQKCRSDACSAM